MLSGVKQGVSRQDTQEMVRTDTDQEVMVCSKCKENIIGRAMKVTIISQYHDASSVLGW